MASERPKMGPERGFSKWKAFGAGNGWGPPRALGVVRIFVKRAAGIPGVGPEGSFFWPFWETAGAFLAQIFLGGC